MKNDLILRAAARQPVERTPVWFMRQAGRYLPEYREIRQKVDFLTLCKTPELAAQVTIQPVEILEVDAAILFSDILVIPESMGLDLKFGENSGGPQFSDPVRTADDINRLVSVDPVKDLSYVLDAIRLTRNELNGKVPLIGFSGSPWTLLTYMVEGGTSRNFRYSKELIYNNPTEAHRLLEKLTKAVTDYLSAQIEAGAQLVQIFDTWGGILPPDSFKEFSLTYLQRIIENIVRRDEPVILFCKGCAHSLEEIVRTGADVIGIDWTFDIGHAREIISNRTAVQGNMDPGILYSNVERIKNEVIEILEKYGPHPGHIFNLGHGVLPDSPLANVRSFVDAVKTESRSRMNPELPGKRERSESTRD